MKFFTKKETLLLPKFAPDLYVTMMGDNSGITLVTDDLKDLGAYAGGRKVGVYRLMFLRDLQINEPTLKEPEIQEKGI